MSPGLSPRWVLVTGCSSGIGEQACLDLAAAGFAIIATARKETDARRVAEQVKAAGGQVEARVLDVTDAVQVAAIGREVEAITGANGLYGLVNNAGVAVSGPVELLPMDAWRRQFEVNLFGVIAVTKTLLPALRRAHGRIVNLSSVSGLNAFPCLSAYAASKFALEAYSDALRMELAMVGGEVKVSLIEPGPVKTPIWGKTTAWDEPSKADASGGEGGSVAGPDYSVLVENFARSVKQSADRAVEPQVVTRALVHALTSARPKRRYLVAASGLMIRLLRWMPDGWRDRLICGALGRRR